jgi:Flp pilus assembly protein TadG
MTKGKFRRRFRRAFRRDQRGGILVTAALSMLPLTMLAFAAVEFHNFTRQKVHLQDALDAAALAVARAPSTHTQSQLHTLYVSVLKAHLDLRPGLLTLVERPADPATGATQQPALVLANGRVNASATLAMSPIVASFFINGDVQVSGSTEVRRDVSGLEVALVLDNTGSMATNNRIGIARTAATNFVNAMEQATSGSTSPGAVKIGLVPFAATVKVGGSYSTASWIDSGGLSPINNEIFRTSTGGAVTAATSRFTLLTQMGVPWAGCVESRQAPYDVQDTAPSSSTPATLFTPYFAPDEADHLPSSSSASSTAEPSPHRYAPNNSNWNWQRGLNWTSGANDYAWDLKQAVKAGGKQGNDEVLGGLWSGYRIDFGANNPDYATRFRSHLSNGASTSDYVWGAWGTPQKYTSSGLEARLADAYRPSDYASPRTSTLYGPNQGCNLAPLIRLTTNLASVKTGISNMVADGSTNIPMGLMWGWHLLSPHGPFSDGSAYGAPKITKVIVLMTDGDNLINAVDYTGVGYGFQGRVSAPTLDSAVLNAGLNARMATLCTNAKASGIVIYAVRVEQTGDTTLMRNCATSPQTFFDVRTAADLDSTFQQIAQSIQTLRIAA